MRPTPTGRIIIEAANGRIPAFIDTGLNLVHVDDVASGHLAALRSGKIGERYILGGQNVLFSQLLSDVAGLVGRRPARVRLPWGALVPVALFAEGVARITGREPFATLAGVHMARHRMFFASTKAERELSISRGHTLRGSRTPTLVSRRRIPALVEALRSRAGATVMLLLSKHASHAACSLLWRLYTSHCIPGRQSLGGV